MSKRSYTGAFGGSTGGTKRRKLAGEFVPRFAHRRHFIGAPRRAPKNELKVIDVTATAAATRADTTGDVVLLNGVALGNDYNTREGRRITMKFCDVKMLSSVTTATGIDQTHRVLFVLDRQANAAAPAITDIIANTNTQAHSNLDNRDRFQILWDRSWTLNASGESDSQRFLTAHLNLKNIQPVYNAGVAGTVADIQTNSLYAVILGSEVRGVTAGYCSFRSRLRFTDN